MKLTEKEIERMAVREYPQWCEERLAWIEGFQTSQELQESDAKTEINDLVMDEFINRYIKELPEKWTTQLDMYLAMKNAMIEALSYPNKYTEPQPPTIQTI